MSSSERRAILVGLAALPLAACGFAPAYGPGGAAAGLLDRVTVDSPADKDAFDLVDRLEERLGRARDPDFHLSYRIETRTEGQAIAQDNRINRYQVIGSAAFTLHDAATDAVLTSGRASGFTAYSAFGTSVAASASEADARTRLMRILADGIVTQLIATAEEWNRP